MQDPAELVLPGWVKLRPSLSSANGEILWLGALLRQRRPASLTGEAEQPGKSLFSVG